MTRSLCAVSRMLNKRGAAGGSWGLGADDLCRPLG
jgi:hypothetical protein